VRALACALALCTGLACQEPAPACRFGREYPLFRSETQSFHDLRTVSLAGRAVALFSDPRGVHAQRLDVSGAPSGPAPRILPPCDGGLDAVGGEALQLACVRRAGEESSESVSLYALDARLGVRSVSAFGRAGRMSRGIALVRAGGQLALAWHDAAVSGARIWYFEPGRMAAPRQLSDERWEASAPSLIWNGRRTFAAWAETRYDGERPQSRILVSAPAASQAPPHVLLESRDPAPSPRLVALPEGMMVSFRDKRESRRKTGLYLARLSADGRLVGSVVRAGRADGVASPVLEPCLGGVVSATPRTFAGDYFVGVLRADAELRRLSAEQQFYEDSREFDRVAVHCAEDSALLLIAERGRLLKGNAALRSTTFRCE
jgi:hypothetical protein